MLNHLFLYLVVLFYFLYLLFLFALLYVNGAYAAEINDLVYEYQGFRYKIVDDGTIEIKGYVGNELRIIIPSEIEGRSVSTIGKRAFYESWFYEISLPVGLKKLISLLSLKFSLSKSTKTLLSIFIFF